MVNADYLSEYERWTAWAQGIWADTKRPEYEADVWMNKELNRIGLEMVGDAGEGKRVLGIGASMWVDAAFLMNLKAREVIRTDIIKTEGIDIVCDGCDLPFPDKSFGMVVCREVIEHVLDDVKLLNEAWRVLEDDGWLYITTPNGLDITPDGHWHLRGYMPSGFISQLGDCGFKVIKKRGNTPNNYTSLMWYAKKGQGEVFLREFQTISRIMDRIEDSYWLGSQLMVLAKKVEW